MQVLQIAFLLCLGPDATFGKTTHNRHINPSSRQTHARMLAHISLEEERLPNFQFGNQAVGRFERSVEIRNMKNTTIQV